MAYLDIDGNPIGLGDTVTCVTPHERYPIPGATGTVLELLSVNIGVSWEGYTRGHTLAGYPHIDSGWYCPPNSVRVYPAPLTFDIEKLKEIITAEPQTGYLLQGGRIATVTYSPANDSISEFLRKRDGDAKVVLASAMDSLERLRARLAEESRNVLAMPPITWEDIQEGMSLFRRDNALVWLVPFSYAPKFITGHREHPLKIPDEVQATLSIDCQLEIAFTQAHTYTCLLRNNPETYERFVHYHSTTERDCLGEYRILVCDNAQNVWKVRDEIEKLFDIINTASLGQPCPPDMLPYEELIRISPQIDELPHSWSNPFKRDVKVKVIGLPPNFPPECIGSIGRIYHSGHPTITVRFRFEHPSFFRHSRIPRQCLAVLPASNLEIVPPTTPCTQFCGHTVS